MSFFERISGPAAALVSLQEAKDQCRVDGTDSDTLLTRLIAAAEGYLDARDGVTGIALVTQSWRLSTSDLAACVALPIGPVQSITTVSYFDGGVQQAVSSSDYRLTNGKLVLVDGASWPSADPRADAFQIDYVAGYGDPEDVPEPTRQLALLMVQDWFDGHGDGIADMGAPNWFRSLLASARSPDSLF